MLSLDEPEPAGGPSVVSRDKLSRRREERNDELRLPPPRDRPSQHDSGPPREASRNFDDLPPTQSVIPRRKSRKNLDENERPRRRPKKIDRHAGDGETRRTVRRKRATDNSGREEKHLKIEMTDSSDSDSEASAVLCLNARGEDARSTGRSTGRSTQHLSTLEVAGGAYRPSVDVDKRERDSPRFDPKSLEDEKRDHFLEIPNPDTPDVERKATGGSFGSDMTSVYRNASGAERSISPQGLNRGDPTPTPTDRWVNPTSASPIGRPVTTPNQFSPVTTPSAYYRDKTPSNLAPQPPSSQSPGHPAMSDTPDPLEPKVSISDPRLHDAPRLTDAPSTRSKSPSLSHNSASNYTGASSTRTCDISSTHSTRSAPYGYSAYSPDLALATHSTTRADGRHPRRSGKGRKRSKRPRDKSRGTQPYRFLTTGTPLQKYCRRKDPHYRHFEVNQELEYLQWYSPSKSTKKTRIPLDSIVDVLTGQQSPGFLKNPRPHLKHQSFSISYNGGKKFLDLICMNKRDHFLWVTSLNTLLKNIRLGQRWAKMERIHVRESQVKSKNAIYMHTNESDVGTTWKKYTEDLRKAREQLADLSKKAEPLDRDLRRRLKDLSGKVNKWSQESDENQYLLQKQTDALRRLRMIIRVLTHKVDCLLKEQKAKGGSSLFKLLGRNPTNQLDSWQMPRTFTSPAAPLPSSISPRRRSSLRIPHQKKFVQGRPALLQRSKSDQAARRRPRTKSLGDRPNSRTLSPWTPPEERRKVNRSPRRKARMSPSPMAPQHPQHPDPVPRRHSPRGRQQPPEPFLPPRSSSLHSDPVPPEWYRVLPRDQKLVLRKMMVSDLNSGRVGRNGLSTKTLGRVCSTFRVTIKQAEALGRYLTVKYSGYQMALN